MATSRTSVARAAEPRATPVPSSTPATTSDSQCAFRYTREKAITNANSTARATPDRTALRMSSMARYVDWSRRPMGANVVAGAAPGGWRPTPMNSRTRNRSRHSEYRKVRRWLVSTWLRLSRAGRGLRSAQDEPGLLLGLFHQHGAGDERQGLLSLERERRRRAGGEPELVGDTPAGEPEVPVDPEGRRQADGLLVDADAGDTPRRGHLDRVRHVAGLGQRDLERVEPGPVRVQEELGGAASDPRAVVGPAGGELRDAGDEGGRRHGLGRQDQRARVLGTARGLLWVEAPARRR